MRDGQKTLWFTFLLEQHNNTLTSTWTSLNIVKETKNPSFKSLSIALLVDLNVLQQDIEREQGENVKRPICLHIRIITEDAVLAMLPWQQMLIPIEGEISSVIEVGPSVSVETSGYSQQTLSTPLLAIPATASFNIAGNRHYRIIQEYLHSYLGVYGVIPRVYSAAQLQREIKFQQPDLLYIYAKCEHNTLLLDNDPTGDTHVSLATLGEWLQEAGIKPVVILSLVKCTVSTYPTALIKNSCFLWIQQTHREARQDDLGDNMADVLHTLSKTPELSQAIIQSSQQRKYSALRHHLWVNGRSLQLQLNDDDTSRLSRQLRAALLRVVLGRRALKESMFSELTRSERINNNTLVSYVVSGNEMACPFDFPAQLQQRLQWEDQEKALPVLPFYLHLDIELDTEQYTYALDSIDYAVGQGLRHGFSDVLSVFEQALDDRGLLNQPCCISLNWLVRVQTDNQQQLETWLQAWLEILCDDFAQEIPDCAVVVNALCLQVTDEDHDAQALQRVANRRLRRVNRCSLDLIRISDALGGLQDEEIEDFFYDHADWRQALQFDLYQINSDNYVDWIMQQTAGEFDATVRLIWQQYQQKYQAYLARKV